jgi:hypothetical protein
MMRGAHLVFLPVLTPIHVGAPSASQSSQRLATACRANTPLSREAGLAASLPIATVLELIKNTIEDLSDVHFKGRVCFFCGNI